MTKYKTSSGYASAKLYNILGNLYWLTGYIHEAAAFHEKSRDVSIKTLEEKSNSGENEYIRIKLKRLETYSLGNLGVCQISLWELEQALTLLEQSISVSESFPDKNYMHLTRAKTMLAFVNSSMGFTDKALEIVKEIQLDSIRMNALPWDVGYCLLFLSLVYKDIGQLDKAFNICNKAIDLSIRTNFIQIKGMSTNVLAGLLRCNKDFENAILNHLEAISILEKIGARCDLAEAKYQLGLTYKAAKDFEKSHLNFQEAIQIFVEIEAPKQVERVRRSMNNSQQFN